jgi:predicted dehydrogenase
VPSILNAGGKIVGVCSNIGASAETLARSFNIEETFESFEEMLGSGVSADNLLIATPPYLHPVHLRAAIEAKYRIYCEKPAAVDRNGLDLIRAFSSYENCMIGFNRRFIPAIQFLVNEPGYRACRDPKMITYIVNLGEFSVAMAKKNLGGGTTVGSCCHYLDLIEYLAKSRIRDFTLQRYPDVNDSLVDGGSFSCVCSLEDGSVGTLVFARTERPIKGVKEQICIVGKELNAVVSDFSEVLINGNRRRFLFGTKGWQLAMRYFHGDASLASSSLTPTLADGIHICELALAIDDAMEADAGSGSTGRGRSSVAGRS